MTGIAAPMDSLPPPDPCAPGAAQGRRTRTLAPAPSRVPRELALTLATGPLGAGQARRAAEDLLGGWGVTRETADDIVLVVNELVTNAIEHGCDPVWLRMRLSRGRCVIGTVGDGSHGVPRVQHDDLDAESGRGLSLVAALSDAFGTRAVPTGKITWFRRRVRGPRLRAPRAGEAAGVTSSASRVGGP